MTSHVNETNNKLSLPICSSVTELLGFVEIKQIRSITSPEEKWLEKLPNLLVTPMLTKDVSWIDHSWDMVEGDDFRGNCLMHTVER